MTTNTYRAAALALAATFAAVGLVFALAPGVVATSFDVLSARASLPAGAVEGGLFRALAAAYMYLVAGFAWMMFQRPDEPAWPAALANAKFASAAFSCLLIAIQGPSAILAANAAVDGLLGVVALWFRQQAAGRRRTGREAVTP